ncbi:MAG TPA: TonB-dependent receptor, partial [Bacteroidota bacterium]|nr:TonB-dependent receptor [Bacteroidota bacterium]
APTFDDLYWKSGGNPNLHPERSLSFDAGIVIGGDAVMLPQFELNYFDIRTDDRIIWTPDKTGLWTPKNLQSVRSDGIELIASWRPLGDHLSLSAMYTNSDTRKTAATTAGDQTVNKQLPYIPHETAGISCSAALGKARVNVRYAYTGFRFITEANDPGYLLPAFGKADANLTYRVLDVPVSADLRLEATNIFNADYQLFPNYPMPLRSFAVKALLEF